MKSQKEVDQILNATLADHKLSRTERRALKEIIAELDPDPNQTAFLRHRAFEVARTALAKTSSPTGSAEVINWLEDIVKLMIPRPDDEPLATTAIARFSPGDDCPDQIMRLLKGARKSIDICVFTITDNRLSQEIERCHQRGVNVRIISDNDKATDRGSDVHELDRSGLKVAYDESDKHMHHKFAIFDRSTLLTGSYNWTRSAYRENEENIVVTDDPRLVSGFTEEFDTLWARLGR